MPLVVVCFFVVTPGGSPDCLSFLSGISSLVGCVTEVGDLPELPVQDEERLQRAAVLLQQRLILRQWLVQHQLQHHYQRLEIFLFQTNSTSYFGKIIS